MLPKNNLVIQPSVKKSNITPVKAKIVINSLNDISNDEVQLAAPSGELSAVVADMQAKHKESQYHTAVKVTVLTMCAERLDSAVLH